MNLLEIAPIWLIGLILFSGLLVAHEMGFRIARSAFKNSERPDGLGTTVGAVMALLGLLLAFTFGAAQERFNTRRLLVINEAAAISTAYLRFETLDEPWRRVLGAQMLPYAQARAEFQQATSNPDLLARNSARTQALQDTMWKSLTAAVRANSVPTLNGPLVQSANDMFVLAAQRYAASEVRVPMTILRVLLLYAAVASALVGASGGSGRRIAIVSTAQLLMLTLAFCLILALDRPSSTRISISQTAMTRVIGEIRKSEALEAARSAPAG